MARPGADVRSDNPSRILQAYRRRTAQAERRLLRVQRAHAHLKRANDGYRERVADKVERRHAAQRERLLFASIAVLEELDRALGAERLSEADRAVVDGLSLVRSQLWRAAEEEGLESVQVTPGAYDSRSSRVVSTRQVSSASEHGQVLEQLREGLAIDGRVVRPADVVVGLYRESEDAAQETAEAVGAHSLAEPVEGPPPLPGAAERVVTEPGQGPEPAEEPAEEPAPPPDETEEEAAPVAVPAAAPEGAVSPTPTEEMEAVAPPVPAGVEEEATPVEAEAPAPEVAASHTPTEAMEVVPPPLPARREEEAAAEVPAREEAGGSDDWAVELEVPAAEAEQVTAAEARPAPEPVSLPEVPAPPAGDAGLEEMLFSRAAAGAAAAAANQAAAEAVPEEPAPIAAAPPPEFAPAGGFGLRHVALFVVGALLAGVGGYLTLAHLLRPGSTPPATEEAASGPAAPEPTATPASRRPVAPAARPTAASPTAEAQAAPSTTPEPDFAAEVAPPTTIADAPPPSTQAVAPPLATPPPPASVPTPKPTPAAGDTGSRGSPPGGVAQLLNQAELARMGERWDDAVTYYDAVLGQEPGNAEALQGKARTLAAREMASRRFQEAATVVTGRDGNKPSGSDEAGLAAHIDFEISPISPRVGDRYSARVYLTNDGRRELEISLVSIVVTKDGVPTARNLTISERLAPGARTFLEDVSDEWSEGTKAWQLDVTVKTTHGDSIRSRVVWR